MADNSKIRMNLAAIKKVDPYAKDIVDSSSHVAFYIFNSEKNEWEKTDVEGSFFIYRRNAEPFCSIFINNRLNTTSFVEPITKQLEIQSQPPFLLYRNERSRIRGFWFYNIQECNRIGDLIHTLLQDSRVHLFKCKNESNNIYHMLANAQSLHSTTDQQSTSCNVLKFFAAANNQIMCSSSLSIEQFEKQRARTPLSAPLSNRPNNTGLNCPVDILDNNKRIMYISELENAVRILPNAVTDKLDTSNSLYNSIINKKKENLSHANISKNSTMKYSNEQFVGSLNKPALMPPTMFETPEQVSTNENNMPVTMNLMGYSQFVHAFSYLIQNDNDFMKKLHEAYLKNGSNVI